MDSDHAAMLSVRGTVTAGNIPACPECWSVTARISNILRRCLNKKCKRHNADKPIEYRWHAASGNSRMHFSTDGTDPAPERDQKTKEPAALHVRRRRGYSNRVTRP